MKFHASKPWPEITKALKGAKKRRIAVTAYLQTGAREMLPLKLDDMLVVNASELNVRSGSTNPSEIEKFRKNGVKCYSVSDIHAKVYVADDRVFVGSANATTNSLKALSEACLEVKKLEIGDAIEEWVQTLALVPLTKDALKALAGIYNPPKWMAKVGKPTAVAKTARAWIAYVIGDDEEDTSVRFERHIEKAKSRMQDDDSETYCISLRSRNLPKVYLEAQAGDEIYVVDRSEEPYEVYPRRIISAFFERVVRGIPKRTIIMEDPASNPAFPLDKFIAVARKAGLALPDTGKSNKGINAGVAAALRKACKPYL